MREQQDHQTWIARLKQRWGVHSNAQVLRIVVVFSLAGLFVTAGRRLVFHALGIKPQDPLWLKAVVYVPLVFPLYQSGLLVFGALLGEFTFFWEKEKRLLRLLRRPFERRR